MLFVLFRVLSLSEYRDRSFWVGGSMGEGGGAVLLSSGSSGCEWELSWDFEQRREGIAGWKDCLNLGGWVVASLCGFCTNTYGFPNRVETSS